MSEVQSVVAVYPKEFFAFVVASLLQTHTGEGLLEIQYEEVTSFLPVVEDLGKGLELYYLTYRDDAFGNFTSEAVDSEFDFYRATERGLFEDPMLLTPKGVEFVREVVDAFHQKHPEAATELERLISSPSHKKVAEHTDNVSAEVAEWRSARKRHYRTFFSGLALLALVSLSCPYVWGLGGAVIKAAWGGLVFSSMVWLHFLFRAQNNELAAYKNLSKEERKEVE